MDGKDGFNFDSRLLESIENGQVDEVKSMLNEDLIKASDESNNTLLHYAVLGNSEEIVCHLIELGADLERPGKDGNTPIMLAIQRVNESTDDFMKATSNGGFLRYGNHILNVLTARKSRKKILELLLVKLQSQTADTEELVDKLMAEGCNLVHSVIYLKDIEVIRCMLQRGFDVNSTTRGGMTALHIASIYKGGTLAKLLIDHGADVNAINATTRIIPISSAAFTGNKEMLKLLLEAGANPNVTGVRFEFTAMFVIFRNPKNLAIEVTDECLEILFEYGAIPQYPNLLIEIASSKNDTKKINMLINYLMMLKELGRPIAYFHCTYEPLCSTISLSVDSSEKFLRRKAFENLTVLELLKGSEAKMRTRARNANLILKLQQLLSNDENKKLFPYYCSTLTKKFSKAVATVKLEDEAIPVMCKLLNSSYNQCYNFARQIVGYLSDKDLEELGRICESKYL